MDDLSCHLDFKTDLTPILITFVGATPPLPVGEGRVRSFIVIRHNLGKVAT